jgi:hypothetical protein
MEPSGFPTVLKWVGIVLDGVGRFDYFDLAMMVIKPPLKGDPSVPITMMAGANSRRDVGQKFEFPYNFRALKRKALVMGGALIFLDLLCMWISFASGDLLGVVLNFIFVLVFSLLLVVLVVSDVPIVFEHSWIKLKGEAFGSDSIGRIDVFIPKGKPDARAYGLRLVFSIDGPHGQMFKEVKIAAKKDQAIGLLSVARARLPYAIICDHSGFLPAFQWCARREERSPTDPWVEPQVGPRPPYRRPLRISPTDGDWVYPVARAPQRRQQCGQRGETHIRRLMESAVPRARGKMHSPRVVAEWG